MYEKIVVPLDGAKVGEAALTYVEDLVSKLSPEVKVEVTLLQVLRRAVLSAVSGEAAPIAYDTEVVMKQRNKEAMEYLNNVGDALGSKVAAVIAKVVIGDAADEIIKAAEEINANLIAMSTHGRSGLSRWAFGSVTDKVLRREGRIPIVMVRAPE